MARTAEMKLIELMVLKDDISAVIEYIGKNENFQFQTKLKEAAPAEKPEEENLNIDSQFYDGLLKAYNELGFGEAAYDIKSCTAPRDEDRKKAADVIAAYTFNSSTYTAELKIFHFIPADKRTSFSRELVKKP